VAADSAVQPNHPTPADVFELVGSAMESHGRADLVSTVATAARRHAQPHLRVVVVGEFKKGKSTLVNALLGGDICPTDDDIPTAIPTVVHHAPAPVAASVHQLGDGTLARRQVALDQVPGLVTVIDAAADAPVAVEVGVPHALLDMGLHVMDTPGVGGLVSAHGAASRAAAASADVVLFVTDALQELTSPERDLLVAVAEQCPAVAVAVTKVDIAPSWRRIVALDEAHLAHAGLDVRVLPLAAPLRRRGVDVDDPALSEEAGYDRLVDWLSAAAQSREKIRAGFARAELQRVLDLVGRPLTTELDILTDPACHAAVVAELHGAKERAERLETGAAGWQELLDDRVADLDSTAEYELTRRLREVAKDAASRLAEVDPGDVWGEFEPWLRTRVADDIAAVMTDLAQRSAGAAREVLARFSEEEPLGEPDAPVAFADLDHPLSMLGRLEVGPYQDDSAGVIETGLTAMFGLQGGLELFGVFGTVIGLTVAGPVLIGLGIVMGGRSLVEQRRRQVAARREQAQQAVRAYLDDVSFHVGKDVRDTVRLLERALRDYLTDRAAAVQRTVADALEAAQGALDQAQSSSDRRRAQLTAHLTGLQQLRDQVDVVFAGAAGA
jgi:aryl carrier-like protein